MPNSVLVASPDAHGYTSTSATPQEKTHAISTHSTGSGSPFASETSPPDVSPLRRPFENKGLSGQAVSVIMSSWRNTYDVSGLEYIDSTHSGARQENEDLGVSMQRNQIGIGQSIDMAGKQSYMRNAKTVGM